MTTDQDLVDLDEFIQRPDKADSKRHMLAIDPQTYERITALSKSFDTSRGKIITALVKFYDA